MEVLQQTIKNDIIWKGQFSFSPERSLFCPLQTPSQPCQVFESIAEHSISVFLITLGLVTLIHSLAQMSRKTHKKNENLTEKYGGSSVFKMLKTILYFSPIFVPPIIQIQQFSWARPYGQHILLQFIGTIIVYSCSFSFIMVHVSMGAAWSPVPEAKADHKLVTSGSFKFARHPMYATFVICFVPGAGLATMNWLVALCGIPILIFFIKIRVPQEEAILTEIFGDEYIAYQEKVGSVGPKWLCFWEKTSYKKIN